MATDDSIDMTGKCGLTREHVLRILGSGGLEQAAERLKPDVHALPRVPAGSAKVNSARARALWEEIGGDPTLREVLLDSVSADLSLYQGNIENAIGLLPTLDNTSDPTYVIFSFNRSDDAQADTKTAISVEYGTDLETWTTAVDDNDNVEIEVTDASPKDTVVVKLKRSTLGAPGKIFARLKVVVTP